jgi:hypothetical protein
VIAIETSAGAVTINVVEPLRLAEAYVAVMVVVPVAAVVTSPFEPAALEMNAAGDEEVHVTTLVRSCVV